MTSNKVVIHLGLVGINCGSTDPDVTHWSFISGKVNCRACLKALRDHTKREFAAQDAADEAHWARADAIRKEIA